MTNSKEEALNMAFRGEQSTGENSLEDLTKAIIDDIQRLPGNEVCCDCGSPGISICSCHQLLVVSTVISLEVFVECKLIFKQYIDQSSSCF